MKTRILLLHNILWSHYKGLVFSELYKILDKNAFDFTVLQFANTEKQRKGLGKVDISCHDYPYELLFDSSLEEVPLIKKITTFFKVLGQHQYDIIIIPGYAYIFCWIAWLVSITRGKDIIISFDSTEMDNPHVWYKEALKKMFISKCDGAFCYGKKARDYLLKLGMTDNDIHQRCQATDNDMIKKLSSAAVDMKHQLIKAHSVSNYNFIYVGRLSREKNIEALLSAFGKLKIENALAENWGLIIVGDGPDRQSLTQMVSDHNIMNVYFAGGKSWEEVPVFYAMSDVFVLPSLSEPWGLVVNEAMVCGLPVIVSDRCGAAHDVLEDGENGFVFNPLDIDELAGKLGYFVGNQKEIERMGTNSRNMISNYTPLHAAQQMKRGIEATIMSHPLRAA